MVQQQQTAAGQNKAKSDSKFLQGCIGCLGLLFLFLVAIIVVAVLTDKDNGSTEQRDSPLTAASPSTKQQVEPNPIAGTLGLTPDEFKVAFNKASKQFESALTIDTLSVTEGDVQNSFQIMLTSNIGLVGSVNKKDGSIRDVMLMGQGNGSLKSGAELLTAMGILITATNPTLTPDERGAALKELGLLDKDVDINSLDRATVRNGIKYHLMGSDELGLMLIAGDANE